MRSIQVNKILSILLFTSLCGGSVFSQTGGQAIYSFLDIPVPARTASLGGNLIGVKDDDINLSYQNPALLNKGMNNQMSLSYINYIADVNFAYVAYAHTFDKIGHFAMGMQDIGYGKFKEANELGEVTGTFKANDYNFSLAYAYDLDSNFTYGVTVKTIYSKYYQYSSLGNAIDAGLTYHNPEKLFTVSMVLKNFGYQWKTYSGNVREPLPFDFQFGISKKVPKAPFRLILAYESLNQWDLTYTDPNNPDPTEDPFTHLPIKKNRYKVAGDKLMRHVVLATELVLTKNFNIRLGYNYKRQREMMLPDKKGFAGFSLGVGLKVSKFNFSYAYAKYHVAGNSHHITITTNLSSFTKEKKD